MSKGRRLMVEAIVREARGPVAVDLQAQETPRTPPLATQATMTRTEAGRMVELFCMDFSALGAELA